MSLLEITGLSLDIGQTAILRDVDLSIAPGEIHAVIGESGSGKSMTALSVLNLLPKSARASGRVLFDGTDMLTAPEPRLCDIRGRDIGMVFQEPMTALNPVQTIGAQVAETVMVHGGRSRADALARAAETLERCELPPDRVPLSRYPHELSGGQRQRVVIAMAIALQPRLLIADEPTTALDVTTQAEILRLLQRLGREDGMALMLISHDLAVVSELADRVSIMRHGRVVEVGGRDLHRTMAHPYTKALFEASSHVPDREARPGAQPLLEVRDVLRAYPGRRRGLFTPGAPFHAVDGVSFDLFQGESLGLVGESGCGKSTLTRAILGLEPIQGGSIRLHGRSVHDDPEVRQHLQVVFQDPYGSFNPRHKVARLVSEPFFRLRRKATVAEIDEALISVGLSAADKDKYIHEFSGGQRQRIAIARALIIRPDLIVLDEAVSALDVSIRAQILDLLAALSQQFGLTYLFISHDLSVVRAITDRVLVMQAGQIVEQGETERVFTSPQHDYTKSLIAATPRLPDRSAHVAG